MSSEPVSRRRFLAQAATGAGLAMLPMATAQAAEESRYFRIMTGSAVGTYFPVGSLLASAISSPPGSRPCSAGGPCGVPGLIAVAVTSEGSVANVAAVAAGLAESGLAQSDTVSSAFHGEGTYFRRGRLQNIRVIANLYPENIHLVVRRGVKINDVRDLAGKRVSIDTPGSGTRLNAEIILNAYGIRLNQIRAIEEDPSVSADLFARDELDAFFLIAGYPATAVTDLALQGIATLLPITGRAADAIVRRYVFFGRDVIPVGTYEGIGQTATLSIGAQWVVAEAANADLIYEVTRALWHPANRRMLDTGHSKARLIRLENAMRGVAAPLHAGAARFYKEAGLW